MNNIQSINRDSVPRAEKSHVSSITKYLSDSFKQMLRSMKNHELANSSGSADKELVVESDQ